MLHHTVSFMNIDDELFGSPILSFFPQEPSHTTLNLN